jgi:hypothetical protein
MHDDELGIGEPLVRRLLDEQYPEECVDNTVLSRPHPRALWVATFPHAPALSVATLQKTEPYFTRDPVSGWKMCSAPWTTSRRSVSPTDGGTPPL